MISLLAFIPFVFIVWLVGYLFIMVIIWKRLPEEEKLARWVKIVRRLEAEGDGNGILPRIVKRGGLWVVDDKLVKVLNREENDYLDGLARKSIEELGYVSKDAGPTKGADTKVRKKPTISTGNYMSVNRLEALEYNWETIKRLTLPGSAKKKK